MSVERILLAGLSPFSNKFSYIITYHIKYSTATFLFKSGCVASDVSLASQCPMKYSAPHSVGIHRNPRVISMTRLVMAKQKPKNGHTSQQWTETSQHRYHFDCIMESRVENQTYTERARAHTHTQMSTYPTYLKWTWFYYYSFLWMRECAVRLCRTGRVVRPNSKFLRIIWIYCILHHTPLCPGSFARMWRYDVTIVAFVVCLSF